MTRIDIYKCVLAGILASLIPSLSAQAQYVKPKQVIVSVKIIEFQATRGLETGLSAYFSKLERPGPFGEIQKNSNDINSVDLTFPSSTASGLSVFLDRISMSDGDIEVVLQALADENKATILFRPRAMVAMNSPTKIKTTESVPYESTQVVGSTTIQVVRFKDTGVTLDFTLLDAIDDDGDPKTIHDTFIRLRIDATVAELGQRIVVALDDQLAASGNFSLAQNAITAPEFITRRIVTEVWVPEGQVLMLGGLYRNSETKTLSTLPWVKKGENFAAGLVDRVVPANPVTSPFSATIGHNSETEARRELVFLIKAESWSPSLSLSSDLGFDDTDLFDLDVDMDDADILVTDIPDAEEEASDSEGESP